MLNNTNIQKVILLNFLTFVYLAACYFKKFNNWLMIAATIGPRIMIRITPIDDAKVNSGTPATYRGVELLIARSGNDAFAKKFTNLLRPIKDDYENDSADPKELEDILCRSLAGTVLVGWKPFKIGDEDITYSEQNAIDLLKSDPDCRSFVQKFSQGVSNFLTSEENKIKGK